MFLGWPTEEIEKWASKWEDGLSNANTESPGWFYHETAEYYVIPLLIPATLKRRLSAIDRNQLTARLQRAIAQGDSRVEFADGHDWNAAKARTEAVLQEFGESLPSRISGRPV